MVPYLFLDWFMIVMILPKNQQQGGEMIIVYNILIRKLPKQGQKITLKYMNAPRVV